MFSYFVLYSTNHYLLVNNNKMPIFQQFVNPLSQFTSLFVSQLGSLLCTQYIIELRWIKPVELFNKSKWHPSQDILQNREREDHQQLFLDILVMNRGNWTWITVLQIPPSITQGIKLLARHKVQSYHKFYFIKHHGCVSSKFFTQIWNTLIALPEKLMNTVLIKLSKLCK